MINIKKIINEQLVKIFFQVILSPLDTNSFSVESFVRGIDPETNEMVSPYHLFNAAQIAGLSNDLDQLCILQTFLRFKPILDTNPNAILYINISFSFFEKAIENGCIYESAKKLGIPPNRIALDISDLSVETPKFNIIMDFINYHREKGFYISIDDIGKNYSNIDKIMLFNPDIIKINHQMMNQLTSNDYKHLLVSYITDIAHKMGILVISTGIESNSDLVEAVESGSQMLQGYFISPTSEFYGVDIIKLSQDFDRTNINEIVSAKYPDNERVAITSALSFSNRLKPALEKFILEDIDDYANKLMTNFSFIESGYLLDEKGIQVSDAYLNMVSFGNRNKELFGLYSIGTDHSKEECFTLIQNSILTDWVTRPFRSRLSNEVCLTSSFKIHTSENKTFFIVMNIDYLKFSLYEKRRALIPNE